ncbi:MAG: TetM/TetW/TetO/TetS family tetracycline resistance ribosomal protection protein [Clostridiales bacterium]|nr:TetM/TetW/TetO/TetS family tetracycline resistance ribosomal protection protein [Clostridiales bacterium]
MKKITIGILAHVDSGKTTLSENLLFRAGVIRKIGRVDNKDAFLDSDKMEKERGITIYSSSAKMTFGDAELYLMDTPGHTDFSPEAERTLAVLDLAVLVISAPSGVQSHTETLWKLLKTYNVPTFIFVNKTDICQRNNENIIKELKSKLDASVVDFTRKDDRIFKEEVALCSEKLMESFDKNEDFDKNDIADAVSERKLFPCRFGSALKGYGTEEFLNDLLTFSLEKPRKKDFAAKAFKITKDERGERLTHMKITGGELSVKDEIEYTLPNGEKKREKINSIRIMSGEKQISVNKVSAGDVCAVTGLTNVFSGQGLGDEQDDGRKILEPIINYKVNVPGNVSARQVLSAFYELSGEMPELKVAWNEKLKEINVRIMGEMQLELLMRIMKERFGYEVAFSYANIAYCETVAKAAVGTGHYEPLRHYAEVQLLVEPLARGKGIVLARDCSENMLEKNFQNLVMTHLAEKTHIGTLCGFPVTDVKITLVAGRAHLKHTEGGDFREATYRALRCALRKAGTVLLEPFYDYTIEVPEENTGRVMTDLEKMGAKLYNPDIKDGYAVLTGSAPVSEMRSYASEIAGFTKGRGKCSFFFSGYDKCHNTDEIVREVGYNPDADLENTADSVFCSHGAGFVVKWNKVDEYKHTDAGLELDTPEEEKKERIRRYVSSVASDEELMAIFERTYGKINVKKKKNAVKSRDFDAEKPKKPPKAPQKTFDGKEYLLVDGYNVIFAWNSLKQLSEKTLDLARNELVNIMCNFAAFNGCEVIVVFDAYKVKGSKGELEKLHNISIVYTKEAETADTYIEKATYKLSKDNKVRVVTSDYSEQLIILGNGAVRVSAVAFAAEVNETVKQIKEVLDGYE